MNILSSFLAERLQEARDILAAIVDVWNGKPKDPKRFAQEPPKWWNGKAPAEPSNADDNDYFEAKQGGFPVGFGEKGLIYSDDESSAMRAAIFEGNKDAILTEQEKGELLTYVPKLTNFVLAKRIKPYWKLGKKTREIALLAGCSESYVKHYVICFERAARASNATPLF